MASRRHAVASSLTVLLTLFTLGALQTGAQEAGAPTEATRIVQHAKETSQLMENLEYLCDRIGSRMTGSASLKAANEWLATKLKEYGLQNVRQEPWTISRGWERGTCTVRLVEPREETLVCASVAWGASTRGKVTGPVVYIPSDASAEDLKQHAGKLRNALVLSSRPSGVGNHPSMAPARTAPPTRGTDELDVSAEQRQRNAAREAFLVKEGVAATATDAGKPMVLLNMSGSWLGERPVLPRVFMAHEHYALLWRLLQRKVGVRVQVHIRNRDRKGPITVYNTVGEIPGTDKANEMVIVGGHVDSWDLAPGAVDNGTGTAAVLEAARIMTSMGLKPRRTVRFVFFAGEEQGLVGSREYVKLHRDELARISCVLVHDTGTGRVTGIGLHGNPQVRPVFENEMPALKDLGVTRYSSFRMGGTDHAPFATEGVPAFWLMQDPADYDWYHHTPADTFDKVLADDMVQGATVLAIAAYGAATRDAMLPRLGALTPQN